MKENRLVVGDRQWAETIPDWMLEEVRVERLIYGLAGITGKNVPKVGDAEVAVYLYTASLRAPLPHEATGVYMYLVTKLMGKRGEQIPDDIRKDQLSQDEERELKGLKDMIYSKRGGKIHHPLLEAMKQLQKSIRKQQEKSKGQQRLPFRRR